MRSTMLSIGIFLIIAAVGLAAYFWGFGFSGQGRRATLTVAGHAFDIEVRDTAAGRAQGLSGRESLGENEGMLFLFGSPDNYGFWMKDMQFPIDIIWIREGNVVGITERAAPEPGKNMFRLTVYHPPTPADAALEIGAGVAARYGIKAGDAVEVR